MSDQQNKGSPETPQSPPPPASEKRSGRVGFDERGNSVWEWQLETGVYSRDVSTQKLKKLELGDLSIAETAAHKRPPGLGDTKAPMPGGGFNPYDNSPQTGGGFNPYDNAKARQEISADPVDAAGAQADGSEEARRMDEDEEAGGGCEGSR
jgi:hypothetical protein